MLIFRVYSEAGRLLHETSNWFLAEPFFDGYWQRRGYRVEVLNLA